MSKQLIEYCKETNMNINMSMNMKGDFYSFYWKKNVLTKNF